MAGPTNKATLYTRADFRELLTRQLTDKFKKLGLADYLLEEINKIEDQATKVKYLIEMIKFVAPQMAAMRVEVENTDAKPVTEIRFVEAASKPAELPASSGA